MDPIGNTHLGLIGFSEENLIKVFITVWKSGCLWLRLREWRIWKYFFCTSATPCKMFSWMRRRKNLYPRDLVWVEVPPKAILASWLFCGTITRSRVSLVAWSRRWLRGRRGQRGESQLVPERRGWGERAEIGSQKTSGHQCLVQSPPDNRLVAQKRRSSILPLLCFSQFELFLQPENVVDHVQRVVGPLLNHPLPISHSQSNLTKMGQMDQLWSHQSHRKSKSFGKGEPIAVHPSFVWPDQIY